MICVECKNTTVECSYHKYKGDYIKLAVCSKCSQIVDKYIEYDNVLLFLDILLLKPQAYRHLCFNVVESRMVKVKGVKNGEPLKTLDFKSFIAMFGQLLRFIIMIMLFEVYLYWAYEEKKQTNSMIMEFILSQHMWVQYIAFIFKSVIGHLIFNILMQLSFFKVLGWNNLRNQNINSYYQTIYHQAVLLTCILVANSIKLLPILMLIWPYDRTLQSSKIVAAVSIFNIIEALKNISNISYLKIVLTFLVCSVLENVLTTFLFSVLVSYYSDYEVIDLFKSSYEEVLDVIVGLT